VFGTPLYFCNNSLLCGPISIINIPNCSAENWLKTLKPVFCWTVWYIYYCVCVWYFYLLNFYILFKNRDVTSTSIFTRGGYLKVNNNAVFSWRQAGTLQVEDSLNTRCEHLSFMIFCIGIFRPTSLKYCCFVQKKLVVLLSTTRVMCYIL